MQHHLPAWHLPASLHIVVNLVVEAAFQLGAHSRKLLRVEGNILEACGVGAHADEVLHPCGAAQLASARASSAYAACFLPCANLLHLYSHMEGLGQHLYELPEVYPLVGNVVEDGLVAIALILHVANLHLQSQVLCYLPALYHGVVLAALGLGILVHVHLLGKPVHPLDVVGRLYVCLLYLQLHQAACQRNHADVMSRVCLHGNNVTFLQVDVVDVVVISLSGVLELHLNKVCRLGIAGHVSEPVVGVQLFVLPAYGTSAESSVCSAAYTVILIVVRCVHSLLLCII